MMRRSSLLSYAGYEAQPHFLESCSLCQKSIGRNSDIFMYRGDTPFCSQECRQEQIERDEAKERRWKVSSSSKRSSSNKQASDATKKSSSVQTAGTVAVA